MQQGEYAERPIGGDEVEIWHAPSEQRMSRPKVVMNTQTRHLRSHSFAGLVHAEKFRDEIAQRLRAIVRAAKRRLRHRVLQHACSNRVALGMIRIEETIR